MRIFLYFLLFITPLSTLSARRPATVLITGCGRSGTQYTSRLLQTCSYDVQHEGENGSFGTVSWHHAAPESRRRHYKVVLHQIRNPLKTIASAHTLVSESWAIVQKWLPQYDKNDPLLVQCAKYWYYWNLLAEENADFSYPIEDLHLHLDTINTLTGCNIPEGVVRRSDKRVNFRKHEDVTWDQLRDALDPDLFQNIIDYAKKWGYDTP